jgi:hypothetical protein
MVQSSLMTTSLRRSKYVLARDRKIDQVALKPPSRLSTQLLAYSFLARNIAASATSQGFPKRFIGMCFRAWDLASGVMAVSVH